MSNYTDLDENAPAGTALANTIDEEIRLTRKTAKDMHIVDHDPTTGSHNDDFLKTIMVGDDQITKDKVNNDIANILKGIKRDAATKQLEVLIDAGIFEFDGSSGVLKIKATANLAPFIGVGALNGDRLQDASLDLETKPTHSGAAARLLITQSGGALAFKAVSGLTMTADGEFSIDLSGLDLLQFARVEEQNTTPGTPGGDITGGVFNDRNPAVVLADNGIVTGSGTLTVLAGDYLMTAEIPAYACGKHQARIFDVTNGVPLTGTQGTSTTALFEQTVSRITKKLIFGVDTQIKFQTWAELTKLVNGKGVPVNNGIGPEVYMNATFIKIA